MSPEMASGVFALAGLVVGGLLVLIGFWFGNQRRRP